MRNLDFQEKAAGNILRAAYEASSWEDFNAQSLSSFHDLFDTSFLVSFRSDERGPLIANPEAQEAQRMWAEQFYPDDPMVAATHRPNQGILQASRCPEYRAFLKHPVYHEVGRRHGVHDYLLLHLSDVIPYQPGSVYLLLARNHRQPSFSREELFKAASLMPPLKSLARWIDRVNTLQESCSIMEGSLDSEKRPKMAFDIDGKVLCASRDAEKMVGCRDRGRFRIAKELLAAVRKFGNLAKGQNGEAPPPAVTLFGENARPIQVTLRLAKTRSGKPFVFAEIERPDSLPLASQLAETARRFGLTAAESQVLGLLARGLSDREIAQRLFVSRDTIHTHLGHLFGKLDVRSRLQAALLAYGLPLEGWQGLTPWKRES